MWHPTWCFQTSPKIRQGIARRSATIGRNLRFRCPWTSFHLARRDPGFDCERRSNPLCGAILSHLSMWLSRNHIYPHPQTERGAPLRTGKIRAHDILFPSAIQRHRSRHVRLSTASNVHHGSVTAWPENHLPASGFGVSKPSRRWPKRVANATRDCSYSRTSVSRAPAASLQTRNHRPVFSSPFRPICSSLLGSNSAASAFHRHGQLGCNSLIFRLAVVRLLSSHSCTDGPLPFSTPLRSDRCC